MYHQLLPDSLRSLIVSDSAKKFLVAAVPIATVGAYLLFSWRNGRNLPPGPCGVPFLGRLPWVDPKNLHLSFLKECEKHGDICSFYLGSRLFIVLNSYEMTKEMLEDPMFAGRTQVRLFKKLTRNCGIILQEGKSWSQQRRLSLRILRDFGFAREKTVEMIEEQLDPLFESLDECASSGSGIETRGHFLLASNAIITEMTLGHRFDRNDPQFKQVNALISELVDGGIIQGAAFLFPVIERFVEYLPTFSNLVRNIEFLHDFIRGEIRKREMVMNSESSEPECLCDVYIQEQRRAESAGDMETFKEFQIIRVCFEFFAAGTDTTARSMEWLMLYMAFYPEIQDRVHTEIDEVVGQFRRPKVHDKIELHYVNAVIDESFRKVSLAATGIFHRALEDTTFHGYRIPADATILPFVYGIHHRADYWEKPNDFYPEHFLDSKCHYRTSPYLLPFLLGRRSCVGESLARMEIFLFFTAIMQRYLVRPSPESEGRKKEILAGYLGSLMVPGKNQLVFTRR